MQFEISTPPPLPCPSCDFGTFAAPPPPGLETHRPGRGQWAHRSLSTGASGTSPDLVEAPLPLEESALLLEVEPHRAMLRQVALRILRCPEQADDAVQEAMIALWERQERPPELRGWLVRTVIHRSLHKRRTELRRRRWEDEAAVAIRVTCPLCDPEEEFAQVELLEVVAAAVSSLPEDQQTVISLRSQGLQYDEIAHTLDLPIGTVRSRLNRARRSLRDKLAPEVL